VVFIDRLVSLVFMYELGILAFGQAGWIPAVHCERKQWKGRKSNLVRCCQRSLLVLDHRCADSY
jgi:hypothetical protein